MNYSLASLEIAVVLLGLALLLLDLVSTDALRPKLGYVAALGLGFVLLFSFQFPASIPGGTSAYAFSGLFVLDPLALYFKRLFLIAGILVLLISVEFADRIRSGVTEYYALSLFALAGMMTAASANDFTVLFVSLELITVTFYVLASYQRNRQRSLEAGVKYLILGALSSALLVFGIALVFGTTGHLRFDAIATAAPHVATDPLFLTGVVLVLAGLGFKIAAVPMQIWAPDVYEGAPAPTTAFLAVGSKAAGVALLLRFLLTAIPDLAVQWHRLLIGVAALTLLYGNLCAIPQRNLKRLMGYSSIAHAGYLLVGIAALTPEGQSAVLFYLAGYLFAVLAVFTVITVAFPHGEAEDLSGLAGLHRRSPLLAAGLAIALVSLAGLPPLAGFFGKFMVIQAALSRGVTDPAYYALVGVALFGVVVSLYYYLAVVRAIYWDEALPGAALPEVRLSTPLRWALVVCVAATFLLGLTPGAVVSASRAAVATLFP